MQLKNHHEPNYTKKEQELLLKAALLEGVAARQALDEWIAAFDCDGEIDRGTYRLLPLLLHNFKKQNLVHPLMNQLEGIYERARSKNHQLFLEISKVLCWLRLAQIPTMVLKGAALTLQVYKNYAIRPMSDIDVLVPEGYASQVVKLLEEKGWESSKDRCFTKDYKYRHSINFKNESGIDVDLHWHPLKDSSMIAGKKKYDELFWETAVPVKVGHESTLAPGLPEALFLVICHGAWYKIHPQIRWIADALFLIRALRGEKDWQRFVLLVKHYHAHLRVNRALAYLNKTYQAGIPRQVFEDLEQMAVTVPQRIVFHCSLGRPDDKHYAIIYKIPGLVDYLRVSGERSSIDLAAGFPGFLRHSMYNKNLNDFVNYFFPEWTRNACGSSPPA